ncbi:MAG: sarcosine oxidase subunit gamma family protein [Micrococcus sp.]|nr:sarcosine oxidase subunit gamma family protein [Micrococcus sp.]
MAENTLTADQAVQAVNEGLPSGRVAPAAHLAADMAQAGERSQGAVALREVQFAPQFGLRARRGSEPAAALEGMLGLPLPAGHGEVSGDPDGQHVIWMSPDEFLAVDVSRQQAPGDTLQLEEALEGLPGQAVDLSANRTILELTGARARQVLEKGSHVDLHPRAFATGTAVVTVLGPVPVILHKFADDGFRLYPRASFADYLVRWLLDATEEYCHEEVL